MAKFSLTTVPAASQMSQHFRPLSVRISLCGGQPAVTSTLTLEDQFKTIAKQAAEEVKQSRPAGPTVTGPVPVTVRTKEDLHAHDGFN